MVQILPLNQVEKVEYWNDSSSTSNSDYTDSEDDFDMCLDLLQSQNTVSANSLLDPPEQFKDENTAQGNCTFEDNKLTDQVGIPSKEVEDSQQVDGTDKLNELVVKESIETKEGHANDNFEDDIIKVVAGCSNVVLDQLIGIEQYNLNAEMNLSDNFTQTNTDRIFIATNGRFASCNNTNRIHEVEENFEYGFIDQDENKTKCPQKYQCREHEDKDMERRLETEVMKFTPYTDAQKNAKKFDLLFQIDQKAIDSQQICFQQSELFDEYSEDSLEGDNIDHERIADFEEVKNTVHDDVAHDMNQNKTLDVDFIDSSGDDLRLTTIREGRECKPVHENRSSEKKNVGTYEEVTDILDNIVEKAGALYLGPLKLEEHDNTQQVDGLSVRQCSVAETRNSETDFIKSGHVESISDSNNESLYEDNVTNTPVQEDGFQNGFDDQANHESIIIGCGCDQSTEFKECQDEQQNYEFNPNLVGDEDELKYQQELYGCVCYDCQVVGRSYIGSIVDANCSPDRSRYGTTPCCPLSLEGSDSMYCDDIEGKQCFVEYCGIRDEEDTCDICRSCSYCMYNIL